MKKGMKVFLAFVIIWAIAYVFNLNGDIATLISGKEKFSDENLKIYYIVNKVITNLTIPLIIIAIANILFINNEKINLGKVAIIAAIATYINSILPAFFKDFNSFSFIPLLSIFILQIMLAYIIKTQSDTHRKFQLGLNFLTILIFVLSIFMMITTKANETVSKYNSLNNPLNNSSSVESLKGVADVKRILSSVELIGFLINPIVAYVTKDDEKEEIDYEFLENYQQQITTNPRYPNQSVAINPRTGKPIVEEQKEERQEPTQQISNEQKEITQTPNVQPVTEQTPTNIIPEKNISVQSTTPIQVETPIVPNEPMISQPIKKETTSTIQTEEPSADSIPTIN